jgi:hypothetical protein
VLQTRCRDSPIFDTYCTAAKEHICNFSVANIRFIKKILLKVFGLSKATLSCYSEKSYKPI